MKWRCAQNSIAVDCGSACINDCCRTLVEQSTSCSYARASQSSWMGVSGTDVRLMVPGLRTMLHGGGQK
jgi:hypothetical protein